MITELRLKRMIKVISGKLLVASVVGAVVLGTFGYALADTADKSSIDIKDVPKTYDTQSYSLKGTIKSIDAIGTNNKMNGIALEDNKAQIMYYVMDAKTSSTATSATGTLI